MNAILKYAAFAACLLMVSCDFLDRTPDNRTEIDTKQKVQQLLVSGYSQANYGMMAELSGDNIVDNNAPDAAGAFERLSPMSRIFDEAFAWDDIVSGNTQDSPFYVWNYCYKAIATANAALEACDRLEKEGEDMNAERGEALLIRAYHHFVLVNIFAQHYKDSVASLNDLGITYMTELETTVAPKYERLSVTETYEHIVADFEAGIDLVDESYYSQLKYHFNINAAHAFGARLYLYLRDWDKVIEHADAVLGSDPAILLRDWTDAAKVDWGDQALDYVDPAHEFNLMLIPLFSGNGGIFNAWSNSGARFAHNYRISKQETYRSPRPMGGPYDQWGQKSLDRVFIYSPYINDNVEKIYMPKWPNQWQTIDQITGVGYGRSTMVAFTTNETLLCRAEAYIHLKRYDDAVKDMDTWNCSMYKVGQNGIEHLTRERINEVYGDPSSENYIPEYTSEKPTSRKPLHPHGFTVEQGERYGIDIDRFDLINYVDSETTGYRVAETLDHKDLRRALQIPYDVISAGLTPNPRNEDQPAHPFRQ